MRRAAPSMSSKALWKAPRAAERLALGILDRIGDDQSVLGVRAANKARRRQRSEQVGRCVAITLGVKTDLEGEASPALSRAWVHVDEEDARIRRDRGGGGAGEGRCIEAAEGAHEDTGGQPPSTL